jgi:hypothetical protein
MKKLRFPIDVVFVDSGNLHFMPDPRNLSHQIPDFHSIHDSPEKQATHFWWAT